MRLIALPLVPVLLLLAPMQGCPAPSAAANWRIAPAEPWVKSTPLPYGDTALAPGQAGIILHDRQIQISAQGDERYERIILRLTGAQADPHETPVSITVDPRFQELVIHSLRLTHGATPAKEFSVAQLRTQLRIQAAEADPRKRDLDPRQQLSLAVPGAQPGDLLECDYTLHSRAVPTAGLFAGHYAAEWSPDAQPVHWQRLHVSWPTGREMKYRVSSGGDGVAPQVRTQPGELDIQWQGGMPAAEEPDTPRWFDPQGLVQLSDFHDWPGVAALLAPQYSGVEPHELPAQPSADAVPGLVVDAMRLLQSKVHPFNGIGVGPYLPADPAAVLQRGYGDSHDLARALVSLLRRLGIDAQVALADSHRGEVLAASLPSPFVLDSALVLVRAGSAQYWLNPAAPGPLATLQSVDPADLRHALLIGASGGQIVSLPQPAPDSRVRVVTEQFDLRAAETQPVPLTVTTQYRGSWAQAVRLELFAQTQAQLQLMQIQDVVPDYPHAAPQGDVQLQALPDGQTVQITARFRLPQALGPSAEPHFDFFAGTLAAAVQPRDEATRQFPLSLPWPLALEEHVDALLPPDVLVAQGKIQIESAGFRYQREVRVTDRTLHISHRYVALADHLEPADYPRFIEANAQVYQALRVTIRPPATALHRLAGWLQERLLILIIALAVLGALAVAIGRRVRAR